MITENVKALISYRLEQAEESLAAAKLLFENELFRGSINRAYYAMFYSVLALLASRQMETSKHSGAISMYLLPLTFHLRPHCGLLPSQLSSLLANLWPLTSCRISIQYNEEIT